MQTNSSETTETLLQQFIIIHREKTFRINSTRKLGKHIFWKQMQIAMHTIDWVSAISSYFAFRECFLFFFEWVNEWTKYATYELSFLLT